MGVPAGCRWSAAVHAGAGGYVSLLRFSFRTCSLYFSNGKKKKSKKINKKNIYVALSNLHPTRSSPHRPFRRVRYSLEVQGSGAGITKCGGGGGGGGGGSWYTQSRCWWWSYT